MCTTNRPTVMKIVIISISFAVTHKVILCLFCVGTSMLEAGWKTECSSRMVLRRVFKNEGAI